MNSWLLFLYKVPHEPSSRRVYVWRKLKRLEAVLLHDAVWALPMTTQGLEQLQRLAKEITELGGDSLLWEARLAVGEQDKTLIRALAAQVEPACNKILLEEGEERARWHASSPISSIKNKGEG